MLRTRAYQDIGAFVDLNEEVRLDIDPERIGGGLLVLLEVKHPAEKRIRWEPKPLVL